MPQMAPMNWALLFISFISIYLICMILIYFSSSPLLSTSLSTPSGVSKEAYMQWKW